MLKKLSDYCILLSLLLIVSVALLVPPVVAGMVNETIEEGDYYSRGGYCGNGWSLRVNVTTDSLVDVFVLPEEDFIGYEVNGVINPSHTGWYSLNTTSFQKNLPIYQKSDYYVVVDNTMVPENGAVPTSTVNVSDSTEFKDNRAPVEIRFVGVVILFFLFLILTCILLRLGSGKQNIVEMWSYITIFLIIIGCVVISFDIFHFYGGNINSALYLLSAMLQSLATILTIVITVTLITLQMASQTFNFQAIRYIKRDGGFITFLVLYTASMTLLALILGDIDRWVQNIPIIRFLNNIDFLIILFFALIMALVPYTLDIMRYMNPFDLIDRYGVKITKRQIIKFSNKRCKRVEPKKGWKNDPLQPLGNVAITEISGSNHEVARLAIKKITEKGIDLIKDKEVSEDEEAKIAEYFAYHLEKIGKNALSSENPDFINMVSNAMKSIAKTCKTDGGMKPLVESLGKLGLGCAEQNLIFSSDTSKENIIHLFEPLCMRAINNGFIGKNGSLKTMIIKIHEIGNVLLENKSNYLIKGHLVGVLRHIAEQGIKKEKVIVVSDAVGCIGTYARSGIDSPPFYKFVTIPGIDALKKIAMDSDEAGLESIKPAVIEDLYKILKKAREKDLDEVASHAKSALDELKENTKSDNSSEIQD